MSAEKPTKAFSFQNKRVHLTYKTWLTDDDIVTIRGKWKDEKQFSYCHENGHGDTPYEHTHIFVHVEKMIKTQNVKYFDIGDIHPNIKKVLSTEHELNILKYHRKEGVKCVQEPEREFLTADMIADEIQNHDLFELCEKRNIPIKSMNDLKVLKDAKRRKTKHVHKFTPDDFTAPLLTDVRCAFVTGVAQVGKTQWALSHFKNPLFVRRIEKLKMLTPEHDGIVFDDLPFSHWPTEPAIHLCDWDEESDIMARFADVTIPKCMPKFFCTNRDFKDYWPADPVGAIWERFTHCVQVTKDLRKNPPANAHAGPMMITL